MTVGFDFGTTNSLVSVVVGDRVIDVLDEEGRPHPSVVRYEGEAVIVGREARQALEEVGIGVYGNTVRSPKFLLGQEAVSVGGIERSPVDIVADVIRYVRAESRRSRQRRVLGDLDRAVVTIPVTMNGPQRAALREAFAQADMSVVQFVHEPLAALYGYLRGTKDSASAVRALMKRNILVVDWGGGTLDLTLCRLVPGRILQLRNGGTDKVGGDEFDKVIRDEVVTRFSVQNGIVDTYHPSPEARLRLLQDAERNKIDLSERARVTFYRPGYFPESGTTLEYPLSRQELDEITRPLVTAGIREIESLLDSVGMAPAQVSLCLVAGGMAAMPSIRSRLHELFGPERVLVPSNSATLISQGAAWIAHDSQRLVLAKRVELEMARGSRLPLVRAGTAMPIDGVRPWWWAPKFVFADQQAAEIHWTTLRKLAAFRSRKYKPEIWILVSPTMTVKGVAGTNAAGFTERVDALYGSEDWQRIQRARDSEIISAADYRDEMVNLLRWQLEQDLGYQMTARVPMHMLSGMPIYDMVFATDNFVGDKIMTHLYRKASEREPHMQQEARVRAMNKRDEEAGQASLFEPDPSSIKVKALRWEPSNSWDPRTRTWW